MNIQLDKKAELLFREAIATQAAAIAGAKLYSGSEAVRTFGINRASLGYIAPTWFPGRTKPLYSATSITAYIRSRTHAP